MFKVIYCVYTFVLFANLVYYICTWCNMYIKCKHNTPSVLFGIAHIHCVYAKCSHVYWLYAVCTHSTIPMYYVYTWYKLYTKCTMHAPSVVMCTDHAHVLLYSNSNSNTFVERQLFI